MSEMHAIDTLLAGLLDGTLSEAEHARLATLIAADDAALARYLTLVETDAMLEDELSPVVEAAERPAVIGRIDRTAPRAMTTGRAALAAAVLIAALAGAYAWMLGGDDRGQAAQSPIAVLLDSTGSGWTTEPREAGDELTPQAIGLSSGRIELETRSGAVVRAIGPLRMSLESASAARLDAGRLVARAPAGAEGFTVHTPGGLSVVDLGTEFAVAVEGDRVAVTVYEGVVELHHGEKRHRIEAGHGARFDPATASIEPDDALAIRFADLRPIRLPLVNGDFETGDLTGWQSNLDRASRDYTGVASLGAGGEPMAQAPTGLKGKRALRLGYKFQTASVQQTTPHLIDPDAAYSIAVRAIATDIDGSATSGEPLQISALAGGVTLHTTKAVADGRWRWFTATLSAAQLAGATGKPLEIRLVKAAHKDGDFIWIDDVQLWRGVVTEQSLSMEHENETRRPEPEGDEP